MPEYLSILRQASVYSIYILFAVVLLLLILKGRIKEKTFLILFYFWLPLAIITQFLMTYYRSLDQSNLPIMNIYFMIEFIILVYVLLLIRFKEKNIPINYPVWVIIFLGEIITHFFYDLDAIHSASILYISVVYFQLTVSYVNLDEVEGFYKDPCTLLNITIFLKAFGYSYFLIYQADYRFPLSIYSILNILVQLSFAMTLISYYKNRNKTIKNL